MAKAPPDVFEMLKGAAVVKLTFAVVKFAEASTKLFSADAVLASCVPKSIEVGVAVKAGEATPPLVKLKLKLSIAEVGLFPEPVEPVKATMRIHTGPALLSSELPKSTLIAVLLKDEPPVVRVPVVVAGRKLEGVAPKAY